MHLDADGGDDAGKDLWWVRSRRLKGRAHRDMRRRAAAAVHPPSSPPSPHPINTIAIWSIAWFHPCAGRLLLVSGRGAADPVGESSVVGRQAGSLPLVRLPFARRSGPAWVDIAPSLPPRSGFNVLPCPAFGCFVARNGHMRWVRVCGKDVIRLGSVLWQIASRRRGTARDKDG